MFRKLFRLIAGDIEKFPFEHRVYNLTAFVLLVFSSLGTVINFLLDLHIVTVWLGLIGILFSSTLFYLARFKYWFGQKAIFLFSVTALLLLGVMHFFNGGSYGPIIYLLMMLLNIFLLISRFNRQILIYSMYAITVLALIVIEYYFPDLVIPYKDDDMRMSDHATVLIYSLFFSMVVIRLFRRSYDTEQQIILKQKADLEEANKLSQKKTEYIESLMKELHHRVKNNLQVISSLLSLQANRVEDASARNALMESRSRLDAISLIHQKLYTKNDLISVDVVDYLEKLSRSIAMSYGYSYDNIEIDSKMRNTNLNLDTIIPLGLIINELVTNSFKHAFTDINAPEVKIVLIQNENQLELNISDNGNGFVKKDAVDDTSTFGMKLIHMLVSQLDAEMNVSHDSGTSFKILIPFEELKYERRSGKDGRLSFNY